MISSMFFRIANTTSRFYKNKKFSPVTIMLQQFGCSRMMATNTYVPKSNDKEAFQDVLPCIMDSLDTNPKLKELPDVTNWIKNVLEYNLPGGKRLRGLSTVFAYEMLEKPENITEDSMRLARIVGWCAEMMNVHFKITDDIMDGATTRRGRPCWHKMPDVGLVAVNDCNFIYFTMFHTLKTYLGNTPHYADIVDLFNENILLTSAGQHLDITMTHRIKDDYSMFTVERYNAVARHKTGYYSFKMPVCLGMLLANITDKTMHMKVEDITLDIGIMFQMQDDFIDCYSDESVSGKAGTDIQEGKCSWLAVTALQRCNPEQLALFKECYGSKDPEHIERIKRLYEDLELPRIYRETEKSRYDAIVNKAHALSRDTGLPPKLFLKLIDMIYNREF